MKDCKNGSEFKDIEGYEICIGGPDIVKVAEAIHKNSGLDMSEILKIMKEKPVWFDSTYPDGISRVGEIDFT